jgi:sugar phosphate isomerase/epimerase
MRISFSTLGCPKWSLRQVIEAAVGYGYDGIDFRGLKGTMDLWTLREFADGTVDTALRLKEQGLSVSAFSSGARLFLTDPDKREAAAEEIRHYAELCDRFDCQLIRVFPGPFGNTSPEEAVKVAAGHAEKLAELAKDVMLGIETHDDWVNSSLLRQLVDRVEADNVGVIWDLHHPYRQAGEGPQETYENIGRHVVGVHVKDSHVGDDGKHFYVMPGEGDVALGEMINLLKSGGYDEWLTLEWEKAWRPKIADPELAFPAYAKFMRRFC